MSTRFSLMPPLEAYELCVRHGIGNGETALSWYESEAEFRAAWPWLSRHGWAVVSEYGENGEEALGLPSFEED